MSFKEKNNFDKVAFCYDTLVSLFFQNDLYKAQIAYLSHIKEGSSVMIIGGGTGKILVALDELNLGLTVHYIEPSIKMLRKAQNQPLSSRLKMNYINDRFENYRADDQVDVVCTFFFLDLFREEELSVIIDSIKNKLKIGAIWLHADFHLEKGSSAVNHLLVKMMLVFFKLTSNLSSNKLLRFVPYIEKTGLILKEEHYYKNRLIQSCLFVKN